MKDKLIYYSVGPLLYCPANQPNIAQAIRTEKFGKHFSLALCLEDTINDSFLAEAEHALINSLKELYETAQAETFYIPKIFIRIRNSIQIDRLFSQLGVCEELITGIIIPKFSLNTVDNYLASIDSLNGHVSKPKYIMPIYESSDIVDKRYRYDNLYRLKDKLSEVEEIVLNIRVGGNDLCHLFGYRRNRDESIHDIKPISDIFTDIVTVYGLDYIVSGPVWEYYAGEGWDTGLINEIKADKLCGFTGKTVIHPNQISIVNEAYKVQLQNYNDARSILSWDPSNPNLVLGSTDGERMNEYKTHRNWAKQTCFLAEYYGTTRQ